MTTKLITAFLVAGSGFMSGGFAQENPSAVPSPMTTAAPATAPMAPHQIVYTPRLPSAQELTNAAAAQGVTVTKIEQTDSQIVATYQSANGQINVVAYLPLPSAAAPSANPTVVVSQAPRVVYAPAPRVVYYEPVGYYDPWYWNPPVSLSIGLGFYGHGGNYHGGHYRGSFHGRR